MKNLSRRELIKLMGLSISGLIATPFIGCNINNEIPVSTDIEDNSIESAKKIVDLFCMSNLSGGMLNPKNSLMKINGQGNEAAWDFIAVVKGYKILETYKVNNVIHVKVEYDYIGKCHGYSFYPYKNKKKNDNKLIFDYKVINNNICTKQSPILEINVFKNHISDLIGRYNNFLGKDNNTFWKSHATICISKYNELLLSFK